MNKNIDLTKILKNCPIGTEFYHAGYGNVWFCGIDLKNKYYPIRLSFSNGGFNNTGVTSKGTISKWHNGECLLFPSKDQRDWSKFTAPWYNPEKKEKFNPKTLKVFDKILVRDSHIGNWFAAHFSHIAFDLSEYDLDDCGEKLDFIICTTGSADFSYCVPFNDDTKHLVGTTDEAPDFYRYWED